MSIPCYPDFSLMELDQKDTLHPRLSLTVDGVSEFTFSGLYLFRNRYKYRISRDGQDGGFIISGEQPAETAKFPAHVAAQRCYPQSKSFFMTPCGVPNQETLVSLFKTHDYWKNISESTLSSLRENFSGYGIIVEEDRNNFDYLYCRKDLAELSGKKYHKKKNHVNQFLHMYPEHEKKTMSAELVPAAVEILDQWRKDKGEDGDYNAAREALDKFDSLTLRGEIYFIGGKPAGYCLGESIARGRMFAIHFEKAIDEYKGIYQFMNQAFASALPGFFTWINREQDIGDEGLRQAKMTYRPSGFVQKYKGIRSNS
ncbi:MAG: phosphatidylglycerol lysyltransferase domain-containing protein [Treponema sp.]|jgi:hypothetical protein|nr:phosphatidylglycerol lysyltransferase domain-containing protein [Treponema sp.]